MGLGRKGSIEMPEEKAKQGKVWKRRAFIKAWQANGSAADWKAFYKAMNEDRVKAGCNPYASDAGLSIQIGKIGKALTEAGFKPPEYPLRPESVKVKPPTVGEDAEALGLDPL